MPMIIFLPKHFAEVNSNPITFPESEDDMSTGTTTVVPPKTMNVVVTPASVDVQPGQTLQFTNNSPKFPRFQIEFLGPSPASPGDTLTGTNEVEIHVAKGLKDGTFKYKILHFPENGGPAVDTGAFSIRSCTGGCP